MRASTPGEWFATASISGPSQTVRIHMEEIFGRIRRIFGNVG